MSCESCFYDVHARYRKSFHDSVVARFNERFILPLGSCDDCLVLNDKPNVLPISRGKDIPPIEDTPGKSKLVESELKELKSSLEDTNPVGDLLKVARRLTRRRPSSLLFTPLQRRVDLEGSDS